MSWPFCSFCGSILDPPEVVDIVKCSFCSFTCKFSDLQVAHVITKSLPKPKPAWISAEVIEKELDKYAKIEEPCPKCAHPELYFYTMQLRSVDEGSTVFYECPKCAHKFSINN
eukprot:gene11645-15597_t